MGSSYNRVVVLGNVTRDPQVKYTTGGTAVCELGMALNNKYKDKQSGQMKDSTTFVDVTLLGRTAEIAGEYLAKGRQCLVEGRLQLDTWDDRETGQKRSKLKVVCEQLTLLGGKQAERSEKQSERSSEPDSTGGDIEDSDVPF